MDKQAILDTVKLYNEKKSEVEDLHDKLEDELFMKVIELLQWENANIGTHHDIAAMGVQYSYETEYFDTYVHLFVQASWSYGGYDTKSYKVSYDKLFSDDWKEAAIAEYNQQLENERKKHLEDEEEKERLEYLRLKAKFEN